MPEIFKPNLDCKCIDADSIGDLKIALIATRDLYNDTAQKLLGMEIYKTSPSPVQEIRDQVKRFEKLYNSLDKIPRC